jgi:hypothetical protein
MWGVISAAVAPYKAAAIATALVGIFGAASWAIWSTADTIGDARELKVIQREAAQRKATSDEEVAARNTVRECHARGTGSDWLWDARLKSCVYQPLRTDRR